MIHFVLRSSSNTSKYSRQDCLDFIVKFRQKNDRNPVRRDIVKLHKQGMCPGYGVFDRYGGVPFLVESLGFRPTQAHPSSYLSKGDVRVAILKWGQKLLQEGENPEKHLKEIPFKGPVERYYQTLKNCLIILGLANVRNSPLANQQPIKRDACNENF